MGQVCDINVPIHYWLWTHFKGFLIYLQSKNFLLKMFFLNIGEINDYILTWRYIVYQPLY